MTTIDDGVETENPAAPQEGVETDPKAPTGTEDETDYKALLDEALTREENYKKALSAKRQLNGKSPISGVEPENEDPDDDDKPITKKDLKRVVQEMVPTLTQPTVDSILKEVVKSEEKRKLVKHFYETRIRQTGTSDEDIRFDIANAIDLVDSKKNKKINSELARKNENMSTQTPLSGSSSEQEPKSKNHKFSDAQVKNLTERAKRVGADPKKYIEDAWKNQNR